MIYRVGIACAILFSFCNSAFSQVDRGSIKGRIVTADNRPAAYVSVVLKGTNRSAISLEDGSFNIQRLSPGTYVLEVSLVGYSSILENVEVRSGAASSVRLKLTVSKLELEAVTVSAVRPFGKKESEYVSRMAIRNLENPQSYSVTTRETLQEQNIVNYSGAVRTVPGIALSSESYQGIGEAFLRGFVTQPNIRNGMFYMNYIGSDPQTIERIEAIKGPSGTLYGSQGVSYGGLLNRVTKKPFDHFQGEVGTTIGNFGLARVTADVNTPLNDTKTALLRVNAAASSEQSFQDNGYQKSWLFAPSVMNKFSDKLSLLTDVEFSSVKRPALTSYPVYTQGETRYQDLGLDYFKSYSSNRIDYDPSTTKNIFSQLKYQVSSEWELSLNIAYSDFLFNAGTVGLTKGEGDTLIRDIYDFYWQYNSIDIQPNLKGEFRIGKVKNNLLFGLDYQHITTLATGYYPGEFDRFNYKNEYPTVDIEQIRFSTSYAASYFELDYKQKSYAAYISDVIHFGERLHVMMSVRYDRYQDGGYKDRFVPGAESSGPDTDALAPKLGLTYEIAQKKLAVFANYMQGLNYVAPDVFGNRFRPERARQTEAGLKIELLNGKVSSTISYYNIEVVDKVRQDPSNPNRPLQDGTQKSQGFDADIMMNAAPGLKLIAGYQYNDNRFTKANAGLEGKRPYATPLHSGNAWLSYTMPSTRLKGLGAGMGVVFSDDFFATDDNTLIIPGYKLLNGNISFQNEQVRVTVSVNNIGNIRYWNFYGMPQQPRHIAGTVALKF